MEVTQPRSRTSLGTQMSLGWFALCQKTTSCKCGKWYVMLCTLDVNRLPVGRMYFGFAQITCGESVLWIWTDNLWGICPCVVQKGADQIADQWLQNCYSYGYRHVWHFGTSTNGRYHGGRQPSSDDSFRSPTIIPPSALDKPSIIKRFHCRRMMRWGVTPRLPTMVMLHDTGFVECQWWNGDWTAKTFITWQSSASMIPTPGLVGPMSLYWLGVIASLICCLYLSKAAHEIVWGLRRSDPEIHFKCCRDY